MGTEDGFSIRYDSVFVTVDNFAEVDFSRQKKRIVLSQFPQFIM